MQAQPAVDNCPAPARTDDAIVARTDNAIVARTDDAIVARTDDAIVARTDDAVFTNTAEGGEEVRGQDSMAWSRHEMKTLSTILLKNVQLPAILDSMTLAWRHCYGLLECLPLILNI